MSPKTEYLTDEQIEQARQITNRKFQHIDNETKSMRIHDIQFITTNSAGDLCTTAGKKANQAYYGGESDEN